MMESIQQGPMPMNSRYYEYNDVIQVRFRDRKLNFIKRPSGFYFIPGKGISPKRLAPVSDELVNKLAALPSYWLFSYYPVGETNEN
jgi:hypothetical protein